MAEFTNISWCDSTFSPWIGCTKVGPGCDHCYAEAQDKRFGGAHWGPGAARQRTTPAYWRNLRKWNAKAADFWVEHRRQRRVFIASQADVFDNEVSPDWRLDLFDEVRGCHDLEIIIVTKRVGNVGKMTPNGVLPRNVILLATVCNQDEADRDIPKLLALKTTGVAAHVGLSIEPMLGPVDLRHTPAPGVWRDWLTGECKGFAADYSDLPRLDWIICGAESGPNARPMRLEWFRDLLAQCRAAGVPFFGKQLGPKCIMDRADAVQAVALGAGWEGRAGHASGIVTLRNRKGADLIEWPADLRVQDFPA